MGSRVVVPSVHTTRALRIGRVWSHLAASSALDVRRCGVDVGPGQRRCDHGDGGDAAGFSAGARVDEMGAAMCGARGRNAPRADGHRSDQGVRITRVLDTDPPRGATRICGVADDVASCRQAEVGVVQRGQKP